MGIFLPEEYVRTYAEVGGRLLRFGSGARHPDDPALAYESAASLANGLDEITLWNGRRPETRSLAGD